MPNIDTEITKIESAVYGEEVRSAICDALQKMNSDLNTAIGTQVIDRATVDSILASEALSLKYGNYTEVTNQTDLSVFAGSPGNYWIPYAKATTIGHMPVAQSGRLFVLPAKGTGANDDGGVQLFVSSQNAGITEIWIRGWKGSTWSAWRKVATNEEITNLKSQFDDIAEVGLNLYNPNAALIGHVIAPASGDISQNSWYTVTEYIKVPAGVTINTIGVVNGVWRRASSVRSYAVFDENKTYVSGETDVSAAYSYTNSTNSVRYIRFNVFYQHPDYTITKFMIFYNSGSVPTVDQYVPFSRVIKESALPNVISQLNSVASEVAEAVSDIADYDILKGRSIYAKITDELPIINELNDGVGYYLSTGSGTGLLKTANISALGGQEVAGYKKKPHGQMISIVGLTGTVYLLVPTKFVYIVLSYGAEVDSQATASIITFASNFLSTYYVEDKYTIVGVDLAAVRQRSQLVTHLAFTGYTFDGIISAGTGVEIHRQSIDGLLADDSVPVSKIKDFTAQVGEKVKSVNRLAWVINSNLVSVSSKSYTVTGSAGTYKSTNETYMLSDLGIKPGDAIYLTIGDVQGCLDPTQCFTLEAYNGSTRLLQKYVTTATKTTSMTIPNDTDRLMFVYRLCTTTSASVGATATWTNVKLYYGTSPVENKKYFSSDYEMLGTNAKIDAALQNAARSMLYDTTVYGNVDEAISKAYTSIGRKKFLMLAWFSDLHRRPFTGSVDAPVENPDTVFYNTVEVMKYLNKRLPLHGCLDTGDIILGTTPFTGFPADVNFRYMSEYFRSFYEACDFYLYSPGNHDGYNANSVNLQDTEYQIGTHVLKRCIPSKPEGKCYYYIDYPDLSMRFLVLAIPGGGSSLGMDITQLNWLITEGLGTVPNGYGVLMAYHIPTVQIAYLEGGDGGFGNRIPFEGIINAFHNHTTYSNSTLGISCDFTAKSGTKIIAALCGHQHADHVSNPGEEYEYDTGRSGTAWDGRHLTNNLPCKQIIIDAAFNRVIDILIYLPSENKIITHRIGVGEDKVIAVN